MLLKCVGLDCPVRERCYRFYSEDTVGTVDGQYLSGMCSHFITKEDYESRTNKRGQGRP